MRLFCRCEYSADGCLSAPASRWNQATSAIRTLDPWPLGRRLRGTSLVAGAPARRHGRSDAREAVAREAVASRGIWHVTSGAAGCNRLFGKDLNRCSQIEDRKLICLRGGEPRHRSVRRQLCTLQVARRYIMTLAITFGSETVAQVESGGGPCRGHHDGTEEVECQRSAASLANRFCRGQRRVIDPLNALAACVRPRFLLDRRQCH